MSRYMIACAMTCTLLTTTISAQTRRPTSATTKSLDVEAEKAQMEYLKSLARLATEYEKAGDTEKSGAMLKAILKIKPDTQSVKDKLKEYEEAVFEEKVIVVDVDPGRSWINAGVTVEKDKPIRLEAIGTYKFIINESLGPEGYVSKDATKDLVSGIPTGALMGMVAPPPRSGRPKKDPEPTLIGGERQFSPKESGLLFLKLNVPTSAKCIGKIKVKISGNISK